MLIAQVTDVHIGFVPGDPDELNVRRFDAVLARLRAQDVQPDLLLLTGDLTEHGAEHSYALLREKLAALPFPALPMAGNHDDRAALGHGFPDVVHADGFVQFVVELDGFRVIALDTLEPGRHGGAFCDARAAWLAARLREQPTLPTLVALHHPPVDCGIAWMATHVDEPWVQRLGDALAHGNVVGLIAGHVHRPILARFRGIPVAVCPSSAPAVALTLAPIDPEHPDERPLITTAPPGFALHRWDGEQLVTHFETVSDFATLARFDAKMQSLVRQLMDERP